MNEVRAEQQRVVERMFDRRSEIADTRRLSKQEASDEVQYTWSNIIDIHPSESETIARVLRGMVALEDEGYFVKLHRRCGEIVVEVSMTVETDPRDIVEIQNDD